jgi:hypothetical protein
MSRLVGRAVVVAVDGAVGVHVFVAVRMSMLVAVRMIVILAAVAMFVLVMKRITSLDRDFTGTAAAGCTHDVSLVP